MAAASVSSIASAVGSPARTESVLENRRMHHNGCNDPAYASSISVWTNRFMRCLQERCRDAQLCVVSARVVLGSLHRSVCLITTVCFSRLKRAWPRPWCCTGIPPSLVVIDETDSALKAWGEPPPRVRVTRPCRSSAQQIEWSSARRRARESEVRASVCGKASTTPGSSAPWLSASIPQRRRDARSDVPSLPAYAAPYALTTAFRRPRFTGASLAP